MPERFFRAKKERGTRVEKERQPSAGLKQQWLALGAGLLLHGCSALFGEQESPRAEQTETLAQINVADSFPVDIAELSTEARASMEAQIAAAFDKYNSPETFATLSNAHIIIEVSSDERPTKKWGEKGNEALSQARLEHLDGLVREAVQEYPYNPSIGTHEKEKVQRKAFTRRMPGGAWGVGFTPIARLENPSTGTFFTPEQIASLSTKQKEQLYDKARFARITIELPGQESINTQYDTLVQLLAGYDHVTLMLDSSGSMIDDYQRLGHSFATAYEKVQSDFANDTTYVVPFERDASLQRYQSIPVNEIPAYLRSMPTRGSNEAVFRALAQVLDKQDDEHVGDTRKAVLLFTDEGIQDFAVSKLQHIAERTDATKTDIYYALADNHGFITFVDHHGLQYEYDVFIKTFDPLNRKYIPADPNERKAWLDAHINHVGVDDFGAITFTFPGMHSPLR